MAPAPVESPHGPRTLHPGAGLLSYLVPGLGQIVQGRVGKGLLFLVCIYTLFFYGLYLGTASATVDGRTYHVGGNVYLPHTTPPAAEGQPKPAFDLAQDLYNRPQFAGQFWVGVAAWPAIWQYLRHDAEAQRAEEEIAAEQARLDRMKDKDAPEAAEARADLDRRKATLRERPALGDFMREPSEEALNAVGNAGDKRLELAWVYTVIAGVLNIMVIYDAVAGAAYPAEAPPE